MKITKSLLEKAAREGLLRQEQVEPLWTFFEKSSAFKTGMIWGFLGGSLALAALSILLYDHWEKIPGYGVALIGIIFMFVFYRAGSKIEQESQKRFAGILYTLSVGSVALLVYGIQEQLGMFHSNSIHGNFHRIIDGQWMFIEIGIMMYGFWLFKKKQVSFLLLPVAVAAWYFCMDLSEALTYTEDTRRILTTLLGALYLAIALWFDYQTAGSKDTGEDYPFWLYVCGGMALSGGMIYLLIIDGTLGQKWVFTVLNLLLLSIGILIRRTTLLVYTAIGFGYLLTNLAYKTFAGEPAFPFTVLIIGVGLIFLGLKWQKNEAQIQATFSKIIPTSLQQTLLMMQR